MRKVIAVMAAAALAVCCVGCAKTISGTPSEVIEQAQGLAVDSAVDVEVTGYLFTYTDKYERAVVGVSDKRDGEGSQAYVALFGDLPDGLENNERVTVRGKIQGTYDTMLYMEDATVTTK